MAKRRPIGYWNEIILPRAAALVNEYSQEYTFPPTLRAVFYDLVGEKLLRNTRAEYTQLSDRTAEARRAGTFPAFADDTRAIYNTWHDDSVVGALENTLENFRLDRTEGQPNGVYIGVEKNTLRAPLLHLFGEYGFPVVVLRGNSSQTYVDEVREHAQLDRESNERPQVFIYAGDFDPSGEEIDRDFIDRSNGVFDETKRIAVLPEQVEGFGLLKNLANPDDNNMAKFCARNQRFFDAYCEGMPIQVELDAIKLAMLEALYWDAIRPYWDGGQYNTVLVNERRERAKLAYLVKVYKEKTER